MAEKIPHKTLVVVADGVGARFFRNQSPQGEIRLMAEGEFKAGDLLDEGPSGKVPPESSNRENDEATFAKQLSKELQRRAHSGDFAALVIIADPETLGQIRSTLHKDVQRKVVLELGKTLTKAPLADIQKALST